MPHRIRILFALAALMLMTAVGRAHADQGVTVVLRPGMPQAQIDAVLEALQRQGQPYTIRWQETPEPPPKPGPEPQPAAVPATPATRPTITAHDLWATFETGMAVRIDGIRRLSELPHAVAARWAMNTNGPTSAVLLRLGIILAVALFAATLIRAMLRPLIRRSASPLRPATRRLTRDAVALFTLLGVGHMLRVALLPDADLGGTVAAAMIRNLALVGGYAVMGRLILGPDALPDETGRPLLALPRPDWHFQMLMLYAVGGAFLSFTVEIMRAAGADTVPIEGWFLIGSTLITLQKIWWFWSGREGIAASFAVHGTEPGVRSAGLLRRLTAAALPWLFIAISILIWITGAIAAAGVEGLHWGSAAGATQVVLFALPIIVLGTDALARRFASVSGTEAPLTPLRQAWVAGLGALLHGGIWAAGLYLIVQLWNVFLVDAASHYIFTAIGRIGIACVVGWAIWCFLAAYFRAYLPPHPAQSPLPSDDDRQPEAPGQARLATVLPIVRDLALGAVVAATALVALSAIGMDIGPLLAGFGVLGLAISFGSQALVRDIVSGIFFMADDAFRIGEYVDTGRLRGTVERITLRSLRLRHQNGQIHTIPFGTLASVTNYSRDWITLKFPIRLDHAADLEAARKTIKKVGQAMLEDPAFAPEFILPLKMQGIQEITDSALVIRCKLTVRPGKPTWVQREALKRIHRALLDAGIPLASNAVTVRGGSHEEGAAIATAGPAAAVPAPPVPDTR